MNLTPAEWSLAMGHLKALLDCPDAAPCDPETMASTILSVLDSEGLLRSNTPPTWEQLGAEWWREDETFHWRVSDEKGSWSAARAMCLDWMPSLPWEVSVDGIPAALEFRTEEEARQCIADIQALAAPSQQVGEKP